jgi:hypothetical protein
VTSAGSDFGVEMEELCGGARILYLFNEVFPPLFKLISVTQVFARRLMAVNPFDTLHDTDIQTAMANSNGVRHPLFIPGESPSPVRPSSSPLSSHAQSRPSICWSGSKSLAWSSRASNALTWFMTR